MLLLSDHTCFLQQFTTIINALSKVSFIRLPGLCTYFSSIPSLVPLSRFSSSFFKDVIFPQNPFLSPSTKPLLSHFLVPTHTSLCHLSKCAISLNGSFLSPVSLQMWFLSEGLTSGAYSVISILQIVLKLVKQNKCLKIKNKKLECCSIGSTLLIQKQLKWR